MDYWRPYVPVARRRALAEKEMVKLQKKGVAIYPVLIEGRTIARSFWGKGWCTHLESFTDYSNRLPRGRTYVRNGSVCHLGVEPGRIEAMVFGSELYKVSVTIEPLKPTLWKSIKQNCVGQVGSMLELLQGKFSDEVMKVVTDRDSGLFPKPKEITLKCSCPDWATMCKHVAAVLYGIGSRLDAQPELLFLLRGVDAQELISAEVALPAASAAQADALASDQLGDIFGIDIEIDTPAPAAKANRRNKKQKNVEEAKATGAKPPKRTSQARAMKAGQPFNPTGAAIKKLRRACGMTIAEFAEELDVTMASVYRWEGTRGTLKLQARPLKALTDLHKQREQDQG